MTIGIIGLGNIGKMIAKKMGGYQVNVFDVDSKKCRGYHRFDSAQAVLDNSDIVFLCIRPQDLKSFSETAKIGNKLVVSVIAAINEASYYKLFGRIKLTRIIPSMVNILGGPVLTAFGRYLSDSEKKRIRTVLKKIGNPREVLDRELNTYTYLTSCSPALLAEIFRLYIAEAVQAGKVDRQKALSVFLETLEHLIPILKKEGFKIIAATSTKAGITEQGINIIDRYQKTFFRELVRTLLDRIEAVGKKILL